MDKKGLITLLTIIVFIGVVVCFGRGLIYLFELDNEPLGITWVSLGVAFLAGLATLISLFISGESKKIAEDSKKQAEDTDDKINDIANTHFLTIISSFEDRRLDLMKQVNENRHKYKMIQENIELKKTIFLIDHHQLYLWKAVVDLDILGRISIDKCKIDKDSYNTLMERFIGLINYFKDNMDVLHVYCESINHVFQLYNKINEIVPDDNPNKESKLQDAKRIIGEILGLDKKIPVNERLFEIVKNTTADEPKRWEQFSKYKNKILDEIKKEKWD